MVMYPVTETAAGLLGLLHVAFGLRVTFTRMSTKQSLGMSDAGAVRFGEEGGASRLLVATRVFGNFAENVPIALILLWLAEHDLGPDWAVITAAVLLVAARLLHAAGLGMKAPNPLRAGGAMLTWLVIAAGGVRALLAAAF